MAGVGYELATGVLRDGMGGPVRAWREIRRALASRTHRAIWSYRRERIVANYFAQHDVLKLQIGCGFNLLSGWLNSDRHPISPEVVFLDATEVFPFGDRCFHYVFTEHMIEHIPYAQGVSMLAECHRVL